MATTDVVRQTREQVVANAASNSGSKPTVMDLIKRQEPAIRMALPSHLNSERFARIAMTLVRTTPKLAECDPMSFIGALMVSAQLGLEPGGPLGQAYLIPRWNKKTRGLEAQFQLGYKGIIELARRSGQLVSIEAHEVCEHDEFTYSYGLNDTLEHRPVLREDRGKPYAYYAIAKFKDGGHAFVVMSLSDIDARRARSESAERGPWVTDFDAMARKTCIRALAPYLPLSPELERAIRGDERVYRSVEPDMVDVPAVEDTEPAGELTSADPETGEVVDTTDDDDPGRPFDEPAADEPA